MVEEARVKAEVKSAHIRALKARLREKKNCCRERVSGGFSRHGGKRRDGNGSGSIFVADNFENSP